MIEPGVVLALVENYLKAPDQVYWYTPFTSVTDNFSDAVVGDDGFLYAMNKTIGAIQKYDPVTRTFTTLASTSRTADVFFGSYDGGATIYFAGSDKTLTKYVRETNTFTNLKSMTYNNPGMGFANDGYIHLFGGSTDISGCTETKDAHYKYDHLINSYTSVSSTRLEYHNLSSITMPDGLHLLGGHRSSDCSGRSYNVHILYDALTDTLTHLAQPIDRQGGPRHVKIDDKRFLRIHYGYTSGSIKEFNIYDIQTNTWRGNLGVPPRVEARTRVPSNCLVYVEDGKVFLIGGGTDQVDAAVMRTIKDQAWDALIGYLFSA